MITLFTDGSARGNPGPGGYGAILRYGPHEKELSQGFRRTTNNRMELLAVQSALGKGLLIDEGFERAQAAAPLL